MKLTVIGPERKEGKRTYVMCRCECGKEIEIEKYKVNKTQSCGCLVKTRLAARQYRHGHYYEVEYRAWVNMIKRCSDPRWAKWYGNISVCKAWQDSYECFLRDVGRKPAPDMTLERLDYTKDYAPENVVWASRAAQSRNTKNHSTNKTGARGVSWSAARDKWRVAIYVNNKQKHIGYFIDFDAAVKARKEAEQKLWA